MFSNKTVTTGVATNIYTIAIWCDVITGYFIRLSTVYYHIWLWLQWDYCNIKVTIVTAHWNMHGDTLKHMNTVLIPIAIIIH